MRTFDNARIAKRVVKNAKDKRPQYATVRAINMTTIDIQVGNSPTIVRHVEIIGDIDTLSLGDTVQISWWNSRRPVAIAPGKVDKTVDDIQHNGWYTHIQDVKDLMDTSYNAVLGEARKAATSLANPTGTIGGWDIEPYALISGEDTSYIQLNSDPEFDYFLYAGNEDPERAPFSVKKEGSVFGTSGSIGGWELGVDSLSAADGDIVLKSGNAPFIGIQAVEYGASGIWLGLDPDDDTWKVYIGDPAGNNLSWDGEDLSITGMITATSGSIGGWVLGDSTFGAGGVGNNQVLLDASIPSLSLGSATGYLSGSGFWAGIENSLTKMHVGDPSTDFLAWDGGKLVMCGSVVQAEESIGVIGGWTMIAHDQGQLPEAVTASQSTINFGKTVTPNDWILIRARDASGVLNHEYIKSLTLVTGTTYNVTRGLDHSNVGYAWAKDTIFVVLGHNGDGRIEFDAYNSPRISIKTQTTSYASNVENVRIGDLASWQSAGLTGYGMAMGSYADNKYLYYNTTLGLVVRGEIKADAGYLGALSIDGILSIGTSGGIYQGTGTFASPTTGLKVFNSGGIGKISGYSAGVEQWYADTTGKLVGGAGDVWLDAGGLSVKTTTVSTGPWANQLKFYDTAAQDYQYGIYVYNNTRDFVANHTIQPSAYAPAGSLATWQVNSVSINGAYLSLNVATLNYSGAFDLKAEPANGAKAILTVDRLNIYTPNSPTVTFAKLALEGGIGLQTGAESYTEIFDGALTVDEFVQYKERSADPAAPTAGYIREYYRSGALWARDDHNVPHNLFVDEIGIGNGMWYSGQLGAPVNWYINWLKFRDGYADYVEMSFSSPKGWDGRTVYLDIIWIGGAGNCRWTLGIKGFKDNSIDYQSVTMSTVVTAGRANNYTCKSTLSFTWPTGYDTIHICLQRTGSDAADTMTYDALLADARLRIWN